MSSCDAYPDGQHRVITRGFSVAVDGFRTECRCGLRGVIPVHQVNEIWAARLGKETAA